jgi:hypothetical protein
MKKVLSVALAASLMFGSLSFTYGAEQTQLSENMYQSNFSIEGYEGIDASAALVRSEYESDPKNSKNDIYKAKFYDIDSPYHMYKAPAWTDLSYRRQIYALADEVKSLDLITDEEYKTYVDMLNTFSERLRVDLEYKLGNGTIDDAKFAERMSGLVDGEGGVMVNAEGTPIYWCYTRSHLKAVLDLMVYNIIDANDPVLDMRAFAKRSDATRLLVKAFGLEKEALEKNYTSPYVNVPVEASPYVGIAYKKGWFDSVKKGTEWNESEISENIFGEMFARAKGVDLEKERMIGDEHKEQFAISIYYRVGTFYDQWKYRTKLGQGEVLRNGDLVSMLRHVIDARSSKYNVNLVENLVDENLIRAEAVEYMKYQKYFLTIDNEMPYLYQLAYQYRNSEYNNVGAGIKQEGKPLGDRGRDYNDLRVTFYTNGEYYGDAAMKSTAKRILMDLGVGRSKAENAVQQAIENGTRGEKITIYLEDDMEVLVGANDGFMNETLGRRDGQFMYIKVYK